MIYEIPLDDETADHFSFTVKLDGIEFALQLRWNQRAAGWYLTILDANGAVLVAGMRVTLSSAPRARYMDPRLPKGFLQADDTSGQNLEAGRNDLGTRVKLYYCDAAELV
jgi:hypothetical protein